MDEIEIRRQERAEPWTDLQRVFDHLRGHAFESWGQGSYPEFWASWEPFVQNNRLVRAAPTDISDTGRAYKITAEIPGIPKDQLKIRVRGTFVEIRADHETHRDEKAQEYVRQERSYQGFYRSFELPEPVVGSEAKAKLENGVLELELPKQVPTPSPEEIQVKVN